MAIQFPPLPYPTDALQPRISKETLQTHYGKHHRKYTSNLNELIKDSPMDEMTLEEIIFDSASTNQEIFNNAAQAWNHNFYWHCLAPQLGRGPNDNCLKQICVRFETFENFKFEFIESAKKLFGSGWTWLVRSPDGKLSIKNYRDADTPFIHNEVPLLTCDVWEHAYYLDYKNEREKYLNTFFELVDWHFVEENLQQRSV